VVYEGEECGVGAAEFLGDLFGEGDRDAEEFGGRYGEGGAAQECFTLGDDSEEGGLVIEAEELRADDKGR
jgi:hypothetical protein